MGELFLAGLNHRAAPLEVRERLAFAPDRIPSILKVFAGRESLPGVEPFLAGGDEAVLLSTCNRSEVYIYAGSAQAAEAGLQRFLADRAGMSLSELDGFLYQFTNGDAAHHLFRVAAGLDSLMVGESEIQGQVKAAFQTAQQAGSTGPILSALFRCAARTGKRVRTETEIGRAGLSIASVVVDLAEELFGPLAERRALLIGAGKISTTAAHALVRAGLRCILVANRTYERAQRLASSLGEGYARAVRFDALDQNLIEADMLICSTGAPHYVLHPVSVEMAMAARPERPLLIADLAVPRDVDPRVAESSNVSLVNIDDLDRLVQRRHPPIAAARQAAEDIVTDETQAFLAWWESRANAPLICALQAKAGAILREQVEQTSRRLGDLTPQQRCALEAMGQAMISKLLHDPIEFLHNSSRSSPSSAQPEVEELFKKVFGLS